jgi:hypothetical protein
MSKIKIVLFTSKTLADGTSPVMLRITKDGQRKYISLGLSASLKQWDAEQDLFKRDKRLTPEYESYNELLNRKLTKGKDIITDFDKKNIGFTLNQFEDKFVNQSRRVQINEFFQKHIKKLKDQNRFGYAEVFQNTLKILRVFDPKFDKLYFPDIDVKYIERFDTYMRTVRKRKDTTISVYLRTLGTLLNEAIKNGAGSIETYPFSSKNTSVEKTYSISGLDTDTKKRFIPKDYLQTIKSSPSEKYQNELGRQLFLFSFYCRGINWIDMSCLKRESIVAEVTESGKLVQTIQYHRAKTNKMYEIIINSDIQDSLDWFKQNYPSDQYLLPCVSKPELKGEALRNHIVNRRKKYNTWLKDLAQELKFPEALLNVSSYFSRHSFAMALRNKGVRGR